MTGDATRDNKPDSHHFGGSDEPMEDEYAQHAREQREAEQKAKAERERCGLRIDGFFADGRVHGVCLRPAGHDGGCHPVPLANDRKEGEHP